jgi:uncharacterized protein YuzE
MKIHYDPKVDALYLQLHQVAPGTAQAKELTDDIIADYDGSGRLVGIEILDASQIVDEDDLQRIVFEVSPAVAA